MRSISLFVLMGLLSMAACGGDSEKTGSNEVKRIGGSTGAGDPSGNPGKTTPSGGPPGGVADTEKPPPASIEDAKNQQLVARLRKMLAKARSSDSKAEVLSNIARVGKPGKPLSTEVVACFKDEDPFVREESLKAAAAINPAGCRAFLEKGLKDDEESVRLAAVEAWRIAPVKDLTPLLVHLQDELEVSVQTAVALAIRDLGTSYHVSAAVNALDDIGVQAARPIIEFLVAQKSVENAGVIAEFAGRSDPAVRSTASKGLGALGVKSRVVYQALVGGLDDDDERVRKAAFASLKTLAGQDLGYQPEASEDKRQAAIASWKKWLEEQK